MKLDVKRNLVIAVIIVILAVIFMIISRNEKISGSLLGLNDTDVETPYKISGYKPIFVDYVV